MDGADLEERETLPGERLGGWVRANRWPLMFTLMLLASLPFRDLWGADEAAHAQCIREMRERGAWVMPTLNGLPHPGLAILTAWLFKAAVIGGDWLVEGRGFTEGIAAWTLRLPVMLSAGCFMFALRRWSVRFLQGDVADLAVLILGATSSWFWFSQAVQPALLFAVLLAWSWLCWLGGYLLLRGLKPASGPREAHRWFMKSHLFLGLAFLAGGPLAPILSLGLLAAFLAWQQDGKALKDSRPLMGMVVFVGVVAPVFIALGIHEGWSSALDFLGPQGFTATPRTPGLPQPFYAHLNHLGSGFFPWVLLLPGFLFFFNGGRAHRSPAARGMLLAFLVPLAFLSLLDDKPSHHLLIVYPFLALLLAGMLQPVAVEGVSSERIRRLGGALGAGLWLLGLLAALLGFLPFGSAEFRTSMVPLFPVVRTLAILLLLGALSVTTRSLLGEGRFLVRETALTLGLVFLVGGTWGFHRLDPQKSFRAWTAAAMPHLAGRHVHFWQAAEYGAMVYTRQRMPELRDFRELEEKVGPEDRLVARARDWNEDAHGLNAQRRSGFDVLLQMRSGSVELMLLRRKP